MLTIDGYGHRRWKLRHGVVCILCDKFWGGNWILNKYSTVQLILTLKKNNKS